MRQEMVAYGMQWYQLDHMQTICTSLQTDNHTNTNISAVLGILYKPFMYAVNLILLYCLQLWSCIPIAGVTGTILSLRSLWINSDEADD